MILFQQALSGVDASLQADNNIIQNAALQSALNTQFLVQIGIFTAVPMIMNLILEQGILKVCCPFTFSSISFPRFCPN
jgi:callose synthase